MTSILRKEPPPGRTFEPKLNLPDRRHSVANPTPASPPGPRRGSTTSQRKGSDTPSWLAAMNERNGSVSSAPERRSSLADGVKGIFGRRKSHDEGGKKPKEKMVITSKHAGTVKNKLKADPRGARKVPVKTTRVEGIQHNAHLTAAEQEERRPHSGNPVLVGDLPMLTRIISGDERDEEDSQDRQNVANFMKDNKSLEKVDESNHERSRSHDGGVGQIVEEIPARRKSLVDVVIKAGEGSRSPRASIFGRFHRNEKGIWTR